MTTLYQDWLDAKARETKAQAERREIEDQIVKTLNFSTIFDGSKTYDEGPFKVRIQGRIDRKIDADKLQEIAVETGLIAHLSTLFRWKPEINAAAWKSTDRSITDPLLGAITSKDGRPSFQISIVE
jgi:hypothetical protein